MTAKAVVMAVVAPFLAGVGHAAPDVIYFNGEIVTVNPAFEIVRAVAVEHGTITQLGRDEDIKALAGADTRMVDLETKTVLPGFYDAHVHLRVGPGPDVRDWTDLDNREALEAHLRQAARDAPAGAWIRGMLGFEWTEDQLPDRWALDALTPRHPVVVTVGAHLMIVNSRALELARITESTPDPAGGKVVRTPAGVPMGWLQGVASWRPIWDLVPWSVPDDATARARIRRQLDALLPVGITSANVAGVRPYDPENPYRYMDMPAMRWIQQVYEGDGGRLPRLTVQPRLYPGFEEHTDPATAGVAAAIRDLESLGIYTGFGNDRLKIGAVKMSFDGGDAGWTSEAYANRPDFHGIVRIPPPVFHQVARRAKQLGWQLGIHTMGDAAVAQVADILDGIYRELGLEGQRDYLHHVSVLPARSTLDRLAALDIAICSQPNFLSFQPLLDALDGKRLERVSPQRSLLDAGIRLGYGSDSVPYNPLFGIWSAVTRTGTDGQIRGAEERISLEQAIFNYTRGSASLTLDEGNRGSIEAGKYADMVVLDRDILQAPPEEIKDIQVLKTIIGGEVVYSRGAGGIAAPGPGK